MNLKNIKERQPEQQLNSDSAADNKQVSPLAQNRLLSASLSQEEGNKLIAEFMDEYDLYHWGRDPFNELLTATYHSSWNKLIPVVEKIENLIEKEFDFITVKIERNYSNISVANIGEHLYGLDKHITGKSKIESVYRSVVEFIKWYNNNAVSVGSR
jgi:hypothetical protein